MKRPEAAKLPEAMTRPEAMKCLASMTRPRGLKHTVGVTALATIVLLLAGCSSPGAGAGADGTTSAGAGAGASSGAAPSSSSGSLSGTVTVFAAASLSGSFERIADAFTAENPGVTVTFNFGGSSGLATQIVEAAPADVFAAASPATMKTVTDAALTDGEPARFASNSLEIAVAAGNPGKIRGLADFANPAKTIAVCAVEVPCGAAAAQLFKAAGITASVDTFEQDVKAVLTKVELGEVDAGIVYLTDVLEAGNSIEGIEVESAPVVYPIATLSASTNKTAAQAFVNFVLSASGQGILKAAGFGAP